jgi:hypothetical protein
LKFARGVPFDAKGDIGRVHSATVIQDGDLANSPLIKKDIDLSATGIEAIFDELFNDASGAFHHLAGCDLVDKHTGEPRYHTGASPLPFRVPFRVTRVV